MKKIKNFSLAILYTVCIIIVSTFIITLLSYFNLMSDKVVSIFKIIIPVLSLLIGGIVIGRKSIKKGFTKGLYLGLIFSFLMIIFNYLILNIPFKFKYLMFHIILIISSSLGSMIGINIKKDY